MKNKFFLKTICITAIFATATIANAEAIFSITAEDLAPYYGRRAYNAAATIQPEQTYVTQAPIVVEEQRTAPEEMEARASVNVDPIYAYQETNTPLLQPMRGILPSYGLSEEDFERLEAQKQQTN